MFEKFGEMGSCEEINELADNLFNEGDTKSIIAMAMENGIDKEMTDAYIDGMIPVICDAMSAAIGKLDVESKEMEPKGIMVDWVDYIKVQCAEDDRLAAAVRAKGKSLKGCIGKLLAWSFKNQMPIDKDIIKAAGVSASRVTLGIPGMGDAKKIIREYYMEGMK